MLGITFAYRSSYYSRNPTNAGSIVYLCNTSRPSDLSSYQSPFSAILSNKKFKKYTIKYLCENLIPRLIFQYKKIISFD